MVTSNSWFALYTKPGTEKRVSLLLEQKWVECFVPIYRCKRKWCYKIIDVGLPLFPRYVFFSINQSLLFKAVATSGVLYAVSFNGEPTEIDRSEIDSLYRLEQSNILSAPWKFIPAGVLIEVESGPLAGIRGIFQMDDGKGYIIISVTMLHTSVAICLQKDTVISVIENQTKSKIDKLSYESNLALTLLKAK